MVRSISPRSPPPPSTPPPYDDNIQKLLDHTFPDAESPEREMASYILKCILPPIKDSILTYDSVTGEFGIKYPTSYRGTMNKSLTLNKDKGEIIDAELIVDCDRVIKGRIDASTSTFFFTEGLTVESIYFPDADQKKNLGFIDRGIVSLIERFFKNQTASFSFQPLLFQTSEGTIQEQIKINVITSSAILNKIAKRTLKYTTVQKKLAEPPLWESVTR